MEPAVFAFDLPTSAVSCEPYGFGHVNRTFLVTAENGQRFILQRLSRDAFHNIPGLMENVEAVTTFLAKKNPDPRAALRLVPARDGKVFFEDADGEYWRLYHFIEDSICLQAARNAEDFYQSGVAFGSFQNMLLDFPAETLHETIPGFHNTPGRYAQFKEVLERDPLGRVKDALPEVEGYLAREERGAKLQRMRDSGLLPVRVTHNDTKLNNVMLDKDTGKALCIVDLDTVMPGLAAYDFGDSIRFGASTGAEDEQDLSKIEMSLPMYETFLKGFVPACGALTPEEIRSLPDGAYIMTLECGMRFLADHLDGDHYFSIHRPGQNLDRARTQLKLVQDMEKKWDAMVAAAEKYI